MNLVRKIFTQKSIALCTGLIAALLLMIAFAILRAPPPQLHIQYESSTIDVSADRAWTLLPGDCLQLRWDVDGVQEFHIEGIARREAGYLQFCPSISATKPRIELSDHVNAFYQSFDLDVHYLPDFLFNLLGVGGLAFFAVVALYYLWSNNPERLPSLRTLVVGLLATVLCITLLRLFGVALTIGVVLATLRNIFTDVRWQLFGAILARGLCANLAAMEVWQSIKYRRYSDIAVALGFVLFVVLLYAPFGFNTIGQFEEWHGRAYLEGDLWSKQSYQAELSSRPWLYVPHTLGAVISADSFFGFNLVFAFFLWARPVMLYAILRHLRIPALYALLVCMLFTVYPVNSALMSLRSNQQLFSLVCLLTAVFLHLRYLKRPSRRGLVSKWMALALCVGSYEAGYALILAVPLYWWCRNRKSVARNVNLTVIWYLIPAMKLAYMALLVFSGRGFYRSHYVYQGREFTLEGIIPETLENVYEVYRRTFAFGWIEAAQDLSRTSFLPLSIGMVAVVAVIAWVLWQEANGNSFPVRRQLAFAIPLGLLLILPAIGVLIWSQNYSRDLWRLYIFVPIPAAIAVTSAIALLTTLI